jgi:hypothetical protein
LVAGSETRTTVQPLSPAGHAVFPFGGGFGAVVVFGGAVVAGSEVVGSGGVGSVPVAVLGAAVVGGIVTETGGSV